MLAFSLCMLLALASVKGLFESNEESGSLEVSSETFDSEDNSVSEVSFSEESEESEEFDDSFAAHPPHHNPHHHHHHHGHGKTFAVKANVRKGACNREKVHSQKMKNLSKKCTNCRRTRRRSGICKNYRNDRPRYHFNRKKLQAHLNKLVRHFKVLKSELAALKRHLGVINKELSFLLKKKVRLANGLKNLNKRLAKAKKSRYETNRVRFLIKRQKNWIADNKRAIANTRNLKVNNKKGRIHLNRAIANNKAGQKRLREILSRKRWKKKTSRPALRDKCYKYIAGCQGVCYSARVNWAQAQFNHHVCHLPAKASCMKKKRFHKLRVMFSKKCSDCKKKSKKHPFYKFAPLLGCRVPCSKQIKYTKLCNFYKRCK
jgi:hypothetical protein